MKKDRASILLVEDDRNAAAALKRLLESDSYNVFFAESAEEAQKHLGNGIDLVLSDLRLGRSDGMELLNVWRRRQPATPFIVMTAFGQIASAVSAMKSGAYDYLTKPIHPDNLLSLIRKCLDSQAATLVGGPVDETPAQDSGFEKMVGRSAAMEAVFAQIRRVARSDSTVLVLGESGTGKELVAEAIHFCSARRGAPFIPVNMAAVPETLVESELFGHVKGAFTGAAANRIGRFQAANRGTIFIDEIGDFALDSQAKLLRALETHAVTPVGANDEQTLDVRIVAATARNLEQLVEANKFREDLYYRLNVVTITLPPLRGRLEDVPLLATYFLENLCRANNRNDITIDPELMAFLQTLSWPGNVRQLRNCLESMVVMTDNSVLTVADLPVGATRSEASAPGGLRIPPGTTMEDLEHTAVMQALEQCQGNRTKAAESLGISVRTLQRRLEGWNAVAKTASP